MIIKTNNNFQVLLWVLLLNNEISVTTGAMKDNINIYPKFPLFIKEAPILSY